MLDGGAEPATLAQPGECAYAEVLVGFRQERAKIAAAAESIGWDVEEYIAQIIADAQSNGVDVPWAICVDWQMKRSIYEIRLPREGWWVQIDHAHTLAALEDLVPKTTGMTERLQLLTSGSIQSEDRDLTTLLAHVLRNQRLDDGSEPLGISYLSRRLMADAGPIGTAALTKAYRQGATTCCNSPLRTSDQIRNSFGSPSSTSSRSWAPARDPQHWVFLLIRHCDDPPPEPRPHARFTRFNIGRGRQVPPASLK
jgi:hypothetical protein